MIDFRVLGTVELRTADGRELHALLAQPKRVALLAYLCVARPRGFHRRDTLLGIFWPEADEAHARTSLRKAIHVIRSALGEEVIPSRGDDEIGVAVERIGCDVARFEVALAAGQLEQAMELYRGPLLEGLFLDAAPAFERWVEAERARLRGEAAQLARMLAERLEKARDYTAAVSMARRAVALAETDERMLRRLLGLLDRLGDRAGALQTYDEFARHMAAEYETEPSEETQQLVARLRGRSEARTKLAATRPAHSVTGRTIVAAEVVAPPTGPPGREPTAPSLPALPGYELERELGRGGMAVVYLAHDAKHDREVAIKMLRPEVSATLGAERFLEEIRTTARLAHPHIVPLLDSGIENGVPYYVMPHVPGETLRGMLDRGGRLPLDDAVRLAGEIASALGYAHAQGIVHQDIKPENILIESGKAVVADFGVSRAIATAMSSPDDEASTQRTLIVGSPTYMSPEQAFGASRVDGRSDIYALGGVVYHMLVGEPPLTGESASAIRARKLVEDLAPIAARRNGLPARIAPVVARALRRDPADRFATAEDFAGALEHAAKENRDGHPMTVGRRRIRAAGTVAAGVIVLALGAEVRGRINSAAPQIRSIALLPIVADSAQRPLADEIHARLIDDLAHVSALRVTGAASSARYRASTQPIETIAHDLDVDALVEATLTPLRGDSVSLDLRLRPGRAAVSPWAREFVTDVSHFERFRKQVARALLETLHLPLTAEERRWLARYRVSDPRAAEAYARGRRMGDSFDPSRFARSIAAFEEAIRIDSLDPAPYVALAETYQTMVGAIHVDNAPAEMLGLANAAVARALDLDPDDAEAHVIKAGLLYMFDWNWAEADREFRRAIALNPGSGKAHWQYGAYLRFNGWPDSAIAEHRRAVRIDPLNPMFLGELSLAHAWAGQGDSAVRWARAAVDLEPNMAPVRYARSHAFLATGQFDSAMVEGKQAMALNGQFVNRLAEVLVAAGRNIELEQLMQSVPKPIEDWFWLLLAARRGDREKALGYIEMMEARHQVGFGVIRGDPAYASLAPEPRFQAVLARMGLPPRPVITPRR